MKGWLIGVAMGACAFGLFMFSQKQVKSDEIVLYGNVDVRQVAISFRVGGQVEQLYFQEGDRVEAGTLLCALDETPYDSQRQQAAAAVEAIGYHLNNAQAVWLRRAELIESGAVSQEDLDTSRTLRDQLRANLAQAEGSLAVAEDNMKYTKVYAPTGGIILTRIREPGSVVNPADPVYTLSVSEPVWIRAFVNEPQLGEVYYGMEAQVRTDLKQGRVYAGKVGFISPVAEFTPKTVETAQLRTDLVYRLRVYVDEPDSGLVQGMPVTVTLKKGKSS